MIIDELRGAAGKEDPLVGGTNVTGMSTLVLDGPALARALPPTAVVVGMGEHDIGRGPAALGPWASRKLMLDPNSREVVTDTWATLQAHVATAGVNLAIFALAVPKPDGFSRSSFNTSDADDNVVRRCALASDAVSCSHETAGERR